jgi:hypothetical protein
MRCRQPAPEPVAQISGAALAAPVCICLLCGERTLFESNREWAETDPQKFNLGFCKRHQPDAQKFPMNRKKDTKQMLTKLSPKGVLLKYLLYDENRRLIFRSRPVQSPKRAGWVSGRFPSPAHEDAAIR